MPQSQTIGFNWNQCLGMITGAVLIMSVFLIFAWSRHRRRIARNERPPQQTKILRPAGHSLVCRIDDLSEKFSMALVGSLMGGMTLGVILVVIYPLTMALLLRQLSFAQLRSEPHFYYLYSVFFIGLSSLAWIVATIFLSIRYQTQMLNCKFGLRGEQAVAEELTNQQLVSAGYVAFHDVPGDGKWNIDHVVIGPSGLYVLETKTRARRTPTRDQPDHHVRFNGSILQFPWCYDNKAVDQVERSAKWVRKFVADFAPKDLVVQPVIVVPGWYVDSKGNFPVKAMPADYLVNDYLLPSKRKFAPEQLQMLIRALKRDAEIWSFEFKGFLRLILVPAWQNIWYRSGGLPPFVAR
jgi:hypothetical protein